MKKNYSTILFILYIFLSCSHTTTPKKAQKLDTILLCTANIFACKKLNAKKILQALKKLQKSTDDIVIFAFQEALPTQWKNELQNNLPSFQIYECPTDVGNYLSNTVAIYAKNPLTIQVTRCQLPLHETPRHACIVKIPDVALVVANVHLFGGRYDDPKWKNHPTARTNQIKAIVDTHHPSIILGDFNADSQYPDNMAENSYWKSKLGTSSTPQALKNFLTNVHTYLKDNRYRSVIERSQISTNTPFGVVSDWIYQSNAFHYTVQDWGVIPGINQALSDHDFVWARLVQKAASQ